MVKIHGYALETVEKPLFKMPHHLLLYKVDSSFNQPTFMKTRSSKLTGWVEQPQHHEPEIIMQSFKGSVERSRPERHFCSLLPYFLLS